MSTLPNLEEAKKYYAMELKKFTAGYDMPREEEALLKNSAFLDFFRRRIMDAANRCAAYQYEKLTTKSPLSDWGPAEITRQLITGRLIDMIVGTAEAQLMAELRAELEVTKAQRVHETHKHAFAQWFERFQKR